MNKPVYPHRSNLALVKICFTCPHLEQCRAIAALSNLPELPGYIPLGVVLPCPDGFVELILPRELPGENFKIRKQNYRAYAQTELVERERGR